MVTRRSFIKQTAIVFAGLNSHFLTGCNRIDSSDSAGQNSRTSLLPPDNNGVMLAKGFSSRIIARSGIHAVNSSSYIWHNSPDGGATFSTDDGGWVYVSNSEVGNNQGGVGALRFDNAGNLIDAYSILENSNKNCAGGATSWNTWLSCEEYSDGIVWECDPFGVKPAVQKPALGVFAHEAVALDTTTNNIYLTEDKYDGCFYRFVPDSFTSNGRLDLESGTLEVAVVDSQNSMISWHAVPDPSASTQPTRYQVATSTPFKGGEGIVFNQGMVSFSTKGDNKIWSYNTVNNQLAVVYDASTHPTPILTGVDNIVLNKKGELIVGEDGGDLQLVTITKSKQLIPLIQLVGHDSSEVTGPAFSPDGKRLYFSSQRGMTGKPEGGITYEITGPFDQ